MPFSLPPLPYDYTALEPYIDATTMHLHHEKHHFTYVTKLNDAVSGKPVNDIIEVQKSATDGPAVVRNNGGGHYNHSLFWKWMAPVGSANTAPHGALKEDIAKVWGSVDKMRTQFNEVAAARFGSGWAWLGVKSDGSLGITSTANQGTHKSVIVIRSNL